MEAVTFTDAAVADEPVVVTAHDADRATPNPPLVLSCAELSVREVNRRLRALPAGACAELTEPGGLHNLAVGLEQPIDVRIRGNAGYFIGGLGQQATVHVDGFVGWSVGENLMSGTVRVRGNASECVGASAHGGTVIIEGDASSRAAISLKGGTVLVGGDVGHASAFMAQAGVLLVGGNAAASLADSIYEAVVYVAGTVDSLGSDARVADLTAEDVDLLTALCARAGFDHVTPGDVTKIVSAKTLYNFDALKNQQY